MMIRLSRACYKNEIFYWLERRAHCRTRRSWTWTWATRGWITPPLKYKPLSVAIWHGRLSSKINLKPKIKQKSYNNEMGQQKWKKKKRKFN
jgi:hypothetical protein